MTREIKFRMWNAEAKKYHYDVENVFNCIAQQNVHDGSMETRGFTLGYDHVGEGSAFEQYIGLKDKNGVEIYEGDVVSISSRGFDFKCQVWFDKSLTPIEEESKKWDHMLYSPFWEECEIIGNIHQEREVSHE